MLFVITVNTKFDTRLSKAVNMPTEIKWEYLSLHKFIMQIVQSYPIDVKHQVAM